MAFENDADAQRAADIAKRMDPNDPRRPQLVQMLRDYVANKAQAQQQQPAAKPTGIDAVYNPADTPLPSLEADPNAVPAPKGGMINDFFDSLRDAWKNTNDLKKSALGIAENAFSMGGAAAMQVPAGLYGLEEAARHGSWDAGANAVNSVFAHTVYQPRSDSGKQIQSDIGGALGAVDDFARNLAWDVSGGNPDWAATIYGTAMALPSLAGLKAGAPGAYNAFKARQAVKDLDNLYKNTYKIQLDAKDLPQQIGNAIERQAGAPQSFGDLMHNIPTELNKRLGELDTAEADQLRYIRNNDTALDMGDAHNLLTRVKNNLAESYTPDVVNAKPMQDALNVLTTWTGRAERAAADTAKNNVDAILTLKKQGPIAGLKKVQKPVRAMTSIQDIANLSEQLDESIAANKGTRLGRALFETKAHLDDFVNRQFDNAMFSGDRRVQAAWNEYPKLKAQIARDFEPNSVILRLASENVTPEDIHALILGYQLTGFKEQAGAIVSKLKDIFGAESPQMNAIRGEMLMHIVEPLRGPGEIAGGGKITLSDLKKFVDRYDTTITKNPALVDAVLPFEKTGLNDIYKVAKGAIKAGDASGFTINPRTVIARFLVGHAIARHGALVAASGQLLEALFGKNPAKVRRQILGGIVGQDLSAPLFAKGTYDNQALLGAAITKAQDKRGTYGNPQ